MTKNEILAFAQQAGEELIKTMEAEYSEKVDYVDLFLLRQGEYNERLAAILNSKGIFNPDLFILFLETNKSQLVNYFGGYHYEKLQRKSFKRA